jgi:hypothetical protein
MTVGLISIAHPATGAEAKAEAGQFTAEISDATMEVQNPPFHEAAMAARFATDPIFFRNLAAFVASELRRQADNADGQSNSGQVIKGQLAELAEGFDSAAGLLTVNDGILTPQATQKAAEIISKLRETYVTFCETHAGLIDFAVIGLAGYVLHQFGGFDPNLSLLISSAVVKKEKLADVIAAWAGKK